MSAPESAHGHFDGGHARDYEQRSRIALAGYDAFHELTACVLKAALTDAGRARVLVVGAGTGKEIVTSLQVASDWTFLAVDPSAAMLDAARQNIAAAGASGRVAFQHGTVADVESGERFDAATLIGVLHHVAGADAKLATMRGMAERLRPGAPLMLASHYGSFVEQKLLLDAWAERSRMHGANNEQVAAMSEGLRDATDPPPSEEAIADLLAATGFGRPIRYFTSLFWGAWVARRERAPL